MGDRGPYRGVYSTLPDDPEFQLLPPHARLVLYTARLCRQAGPAVIFRYYPETLARQTGLPMKAVKASLEVLREYRWIDYDDSILWVRNGLRYDPGMHLSDEKHRKAVERQLRELPKHDIVLRFCDYYQIVRPFEGPSRPHIETSALKTEDLRLKTDSETETEDRDMSGCEPDGMALGGHGVNGSSITPATASTLARHVGVEHWNREHGPSGLRTAAKEVLAFLNKKAGKHFLPTPVNVDLITARLREGATVEHCRAIVGMKCAKWLNDPKMREYLRPSTLFNREKFNQYLGELPSTAFAEGGAANGV